VLQAQGLSLSLQFSDFPAPYAWVSTQHGSYLDVYTHLGITQHRHSLSHVHVSFIMRMLMLGRVAGVEIW
jgi:hypothetical protein